MYYITPVLHIYVTGGGKHGTAKEKAKVDPERGNLVESKLHNGV